MLRAFVLGITQSLAEFLPISSSAHLILLPLFFGWEDQGLPMDVALHLGTLFSVLLYFRADVVALAKGAFEMMRGRLNTENARFSAKLIIAVLPILFVGFFAGDAVAENFRSPRLIAVVMILFGVFLYVADRFGSKRFAVSDLTFGKALLIGLAQVLAIVPGVSRSGVTISAARLLGVRREEAARFSMLLSVPTIGAAGGYGALQMILSSSAGESPDVILFGMLVSFAGGLGAVWFLMKWVKKASFALFAVYRILLGGLLFYLF